jgi:hypothetical protein
MGPPLQPKLAFLHPEESLSKVKLEQFRRLSSEVLKQSLLPGQKDSLKVRPDGTLLDGHHRIYVLLERNEDPNLLPRDIIERKP